MSEKGRTRWWWLLGLPLLAAAGIGFWWLSSYAAHARVAEQAIERDLKQHPALVDVLGRIERIEVDLGQSLIGEKHTWVYQVTGTQGAGRLSVQHVENMDGDLVIRWASLEKNDGEVIHIVTEE